MLVALAGGFGGPRLIAGLLDVLPPPEITVIGNTGDDLVRHGLHISPDLDSVVYRLAGALNPELGWGLAGETWRVMDALERYRGENWFRLGDADLATHLYRTQRLADGATLSEVTGEIARAWGLELRVVPMSDDPVGTKVTVDGEGELPFQDYFVRLHHSVPVSAVRFDGADIARPAPGLVDTIAAASRIVIGPSNPIVSIGPILSIAGIRTAIAARRRDVVAVSPIVGGSALKGPAEHLLRELGHEASVVGVARYYADLAGCLVIDEVDADLAPRVEAEGVRCVVTKTVMADRDLAASLARVVVEARA
jgi:LPPG:FO 2-phospho-L-lactate transferase